MLDVTAVELNVTPFLPDGFAPAAVGRATVLATMSVEAAAVMMAAGRVH
jgi:hypothetical protein